MTEETHKVGDIFDEVVELAEDFCYHLSNIIDASDCPACHGDEAVARRLAERLHAAGWRPEDTVQRAAELLARSS